MISPGLVVQNRYRVVKLLGKGGFGETFEVEVRGTTKVLKVLNLEKFHDSETKEKAIALFQREAEVLKKLNHHGIPKVEPDGYFIWQGFYCLVMEKIAGQNLQEWLQERGDANGSAKRLRTLTQEQAIDWLKQLAIILDKLHKQQYFHRDIKPSNIMLKPDGQLALIDFGAVREISSTYLAKIVEDREVTVLGSPGYAPREQTEGKAVPQSDFYALGRTFVHLLTGIHPRQLREDKLTGELIWRDCANNISEPLADLIDETLCLFPGERPENAQVILQRLQAIVNDLTPQPPSLLGEGLGERFLRMDRLRLLTTILASVAMTALVMGVRQLGMLQAIELQAFDQLLRSRPADKGPDSRIFVVEVTEEDIKKYGYPLPDTILAQLIDKLETYQPRAIGLNIFRDRPVGNNPTALAASWQRNQHLIASCYTASPESSKRPGIAPPKNVPESRTGFTDLVEDSDGILRRHLVFQPLIPNSLCATKFSFSFRLAQRYLELEGIEPQTTPENYVQLGKAVFKPLKASSGGYRREELGGFQMLLNYRSSPQTTTQAFTFRTVTLQEVFSGLVNPDLLKDQIALIGMNISTSSNFFNPYNAELQRYEGIPAVMVQAQMVSQILSAVLDGRPLLCVWPQWGEFLWVWGWSLLGGALALRMRSLIHLGMAGGVIVIALYGFCFILLTQGIWAPLVPPGLALIATVGARSLLPHLRFGNSN